MSTNSHPRYTDAGMKLFIDLDGENPPEQAGTPLTESVAWGRALAASRRWDSAAALADYLAEQFCYWAARCPTTEERLAMARTASAVWTDAVSEQAVPSEPPYRARWHHALAEGGIQ